MASTALKAPTTLDEFLAWEDEQPERYEFLDGLVRMMTGGTEDHDRLSVNLIALLRNALRGGPCSVHASNLKVVSRAGNASMYPELFVRCMAVPSQSEAIRVLCDSLRGLHQG